MLAFRPKPSSNPHRSSNPPSSKHRNLRDRYHVKEPLGKGLTGTVFRALDNRDHSYVAIKVVLKRTLQTNSEKRALSREIDVLRHLNHKSVLSFRHAFEDHRAVYIITEFCSRGDLFTYLKSKSLGLPEREALKYLRQIFDALEYLHRHDISHRDIKPENILIAHDGKVKIADFGLCHWRKPNGPLSSRQHCGTLQYTAPEIAANRSYIPECADMWSCGILFYAMLTRSLPYRSSDSHALSREICQLDVLSLLKSRKLEHLSKQTRTLLSALLSHVPERRPTASQAVNLVDDALLGPREPRYKHMPW